LNREILTPFIPDNYRSAYAQFTIILKSKELRDRLILELNSFGIPTSVFYPKTLSQQTAYLNESSNYRVNLNASSSVNRVLSLPIHPYLSFREINFIIDKINKSGVFND
jgi:dTDP-4-amino-4,6-dideoxygalactose transaminase